MLHCGSLASYCIHNAMWCLDSSFFLEISKYIVFNGKNCMFLQVCERLGPSLYDFLRKNNYRPFSVDLVREFGRQLLESVACMFLIL